MNLGEVRASMNFDISNFSTNLNRAQTELNSFEQRSQRIASGMTSTGKKMSMGLTLPLVAVGTAMTKFAMDAEETENLFTESMGNMASEANLWAKELNKALGINTIELKQNVGMFNAMFNSMNLGTKASYDMATGLTELAYDMASFYNLNPTEAFEKLQAGITGEAEPLKRLGILINDTTLKTYAYTNGIVAQGEELTEQQKVFARYGLIMEQTKSAQGDLARTIDSPTNKLRLMTQILKETATNFGKELIPMVSVVIEKLNNLAKWFNELSPAGKKVTITIALIVASIGPLLLSIGNLITAVLNIRKAVIALKAALTALNFNPIILAITALVAAVALIGLAAYKAGKKTEEEVEKIKKKYDELRDKAKQTSNEILDNAINNINEESDKKIKAHNDEITRIEEEYNEKISRAEEGKDKKIEALQEEKKALEDTYRNSIDKINEEYGVVKDTIKSKTDLVNEYYDNEIDKINRVHDEKIKLINIELDKQLQAIEEQKSEKIYNLELELAKVQGATEDEIAELRRKQLEEKLVAQEKKALDATNDNERLLAINERERLIQEAINNRVLVETQIEEQSVKDKIFQAELEAQTKIEIAQTNANEKISIVEENLNKEIEVINNKKDEEIKAIQEEREAKIKAEDEKYEAQMTSLENQLEKQDEYLENYKKKLEEEVEAKIAAEKAKVAAEEQARQQSIANAEKDREYWDKYTESLLKRSEAEEILKKLDNANQGRSSNGERGTSNNSSTEDSSSNARRRGYATGTTSAKKGWAWTGENGPELINFDGGEKVYSNSESMSMIGNLLASLKIKIPSANNGSSSNNNNIVININGGDKDRIYKTVRHALGGNI